MRINKVKLTRNKIKLKNWWAQNRADLALPVGWALITLAAFQFTLRAWEASAGAYLIFYVVVRASGAWIEAKAAAVRRHARGD